MVKRFQGGGCCCPSGPLRCEFCSSDDIPEVYVTLTFNNFRCNPCSANNGTYTLPATSPGACSWQDTFATAGACGCGKLIITLSRSPSGGGDFWTLGVDHQNSAGTFQCDTWLFTTAAQPCKVTGLAMTPQASVPSSGPVCAFSNTGGLLAASITT